MIAKMEVSDLDGFIKVHEYLEHAILLQGSGALQISLHQATLHDEDDSPSLEILSATMALQLTCMLVEKPYLGYLRWVLGCQSSSFSHASPRWKISLYN